VKYSGKQLSVQEIYVQHNIDTSYIKKNYKAILLMMEEAGEIQVVDPMKKKRRKDTMADRLMVTFPA